MNEVEKQAAIAAANATAIERIARMLKIEPTEESAIPALQMVMNSDQMKAYKLSLYFGSEADRCFEQKAFFAAALLTVAANEAFLTVTCLQEEAAVRSTAVYRGMNRPGRRYRDVMAEFGLDKLIKIANELKWIPKDVVNSNLVAAVITDFPSLARTVYPNWPASRVSDTIRSFQTAPGPEMLKVMQDMRNLVHAPRWLKTGSLLHDSEFEANCKLAVLVGREVIQCLSIRSVRKFEAGLQTLSSFDSMPAEVQTNIRNLLLKGL